MWARVDPHVREGSRHRAFVVLEEAVVGYVQHLRVQLVRHEPVHPGLQLRMKDYARSRDFAERTVVRRDIHRDR